MNDEDVGVNELFEPFGSSLASRAASRRSFIVGGSALLVSACARSSSPPVPQEMTVPTLVSRPLATLPTTELSWLMLRDHFIATVGPQSGKGRALGSLIVLADGE